MRSWYINNILVPIGDYNNQSFNDDTSSSHQAQLWLHSMTKRKVRDLLMLTGAN